MADGIRWALIALLWGQSVLLLVVTFNHYHALNRHRADFASWWSQTYGLTVAYALLAVVQARGLHEHLGDPWTFQTWLITIATIVGMLSVLLRAYWWLRDR